MRRPQADALAPKTDRAEWPIAHPARRLNSGRVVYLRSRESCINPQSLLSRTTRRVLDVAARCRWLWSLRVGPPHRTSASALNPSLDMPGRDRRRPVGGTPDENAKTAGDRRATP